MLNSGYCRSGDVAFARRGSATWLGVFLLALLCPCVAAPAAPPSKSKTETAKDRQQPDEARAKKARQRAAAVTAIANRGHLGEGGVVADIGAGNGRDSWVFAGIVGPRGTVYAEEISDKQVATIQAEARKRKLSQVRAVLGRDDDPGLPPACADLAYMHFVYHHFSKPREMLRGIWRSLKPGGYLVVVDRNRGTLRDWVPREQRKNKHFWSAETTVVREAREEGFRFIACPDDWSESPEPFVLVFQRPHDPAQPGHDPDPFSPLEVSKAAALLLPRDRCQYPVFIALGEGRKLLAPILQRSSGAGLDIVLEEWATQKDERPPLPVGVSLPSVLTHNGDPHLPDRPIDAVYFLDSYHLLFHGPALLGKLHERLTPDGQVFVMDRLSQKPLSRREASHQRRIDPETVKREMAAAGFCLNREEARPSPDRFLLDFGRKSGR